MDKIIQEFSGYTQKILNELKEELKSIRTGRANPAILENIIVEAYGGQTKLKITELATIITEDSTTLSITPFDSSTIQDIEKSIFKSPLGLSPQVQDTRIIVRVPALSEEQRIKYVKVINQKVEEKKVMIRNQRDEMRKKIKNAYEAKEVTEDQKYNLEKEIDNVNQKISPQIQSVKEAKEREIMEV